jgi:hypothetical protein
VISVLFNYKSAYVNYSSSGCKRIATFPSTTSLRSINHIIPIPLRRGRLGRQHYPSLLSSCHRLAILFNTPLDK